MYSGKAHGDVRVESTGKAYPWSVMAMGEQWFVVYLAGDDVTEQAKRLRTAGLAFDSCAEAHKLLEAYES